MLFGCNYLSWLSTLYDATLTRNRKKTQKSQKLMNLTLTKFISEKITCNHYSKVYGVLFEIIKFQSIEIGKM